MKLMKTIIALLLRATGVLLCVRADDDEAATAARLERACHEAGKVGTALCTTMKSPLWDTLRAGWPSDEPLVVADVGANKGFFSATALARFSPACGVAGGVT